jgi:hypothetical protein
MRTGWVLSAAATVIVGTVVIPTGLMVAGTLVAGDASTDGYTCSTPTAGPALPITASQTISDTVEGHGTVTLDPEQTGYARTIIGTGQSLKVSTRGQTIALMVALQESTLRNLSWGDRDSVGLFQQRRAGWGTTAQRTDPATSARMFYTGGLDGAPGLLDVDNWEAMPLGVAAQTVQVSAFPGAYAKWEALAGRAVAVISGGVVAEPEPTCVLVTPTPSEAPAAPGGACKAATDVKAQFSNGRLPDSALCPLPFAKGHRLRADAAAAVIRLNVAYRERFGADMCVTDSYRTYAEQVRLFATKPGLAARPGTSNHGWGLALDLCGGLQNAGTAQDSWMHAHSREFGWEHPDWAEPDGSRPEAWHWGYFAAGDRT